MEEKECEEGIVLKTETGGKERREEEKNGKRERKNWWQKEVEYEAEKRK